MIDVVHDGIYQTHHWDRFSQLDISADYRLSRLFCLHFGVASLSAIAVLFNKLIVLPRYRYLVVFAQLCVCIALVFFLRSCLRDSKHRPIVLED